MLGFYDMLLAVCTKKLNSLGIIGEIILIPITLLWMCWSLIIPYMLEGGWITYIPSGIVSLLLMIRGYGIISKITRKH